MKKQLFTILALLMCMTSSAQHINYFRISLGPKAERYTLSNPGVLEAMPHIDVSAGAYIGKNISNEWQVEIGLIKNDYSSKLKLNLDEAVFFDGFVYPTMTTVQLPVLGIYQRRYSEKLSFYARGGIHVILNSKLSREGSNVLDEARVNEDGQVLQTASITTYSNGKEAGNLLLRADVGLYFSVNENLALELSGSLKGGTLPLNSYQVDYSSTNVQHNSATFETKGNSMHLNLGIKYKIFD